MYKKSDVQKYLFHFQIALPSYFRLILQKTGSNVDFALAQQTKSVSIHNIVCVLWKLAVYDTRKSFGGRKKVCKVMINQEKPEHNEAGEFTIGTFSKEKKGFPVRGELEVCMTKVTTSAASIMFNLRKSHTQSTDDTLPKVSFKCLSIPFTMAASN